MNLGYTRRSCIISLSYTLNIQNQTCFDKTQVEVHGGLKHSPEPADC